jgi:hypothetical protein
MHPNYNDTLDYDTFKEFVSTNITHHLKLETRCASHLLSGT